MWVMSSVYSGTDVPVSARRVCSVVPCDIPLESWTGTVCTDSNEFVIDFFKVLTIVQHNELVILAAFLSRFTPSIVFLLRRSLRLFLDRSVDLLLLSSCL